MRRIGGLVLLLLLAACQPADRSVEVTGPPPTSEPATTTTTTPPSTTSSTTSSTSTTTSPPRLPATTVAAPAGRCDPNYAGACVPIDSDVDCGGGTGNGPSYVYAKNFQVVGRDIYRLDSDGDGIACER